MYNFSRKIPVSSSFSQVNRHRSNYSHKQINKHDYRFLTAKKFEYTPEESKKQDEEEIEENPSILDHHSFAQNFRKKCAAPENKRKNLSEKSTKSNYNKLEDIDHYIDYMRSIRNKPYFLSKSLTNWSLKTNSTGRSEDVELEEKSKKRANPKKKSKKRSTFSSIKDNPQVTQDHYQSNSLPNWSTELVLPTNTLISDHKSTTASTRGLEVNSWKKPTTAAPRRWDVPPKFSLDPSLKVSTIAEFVLRRKKEEQEMAKQRIQQESNELRRNLERRY